MTERYDRDDWQRELQAFTERNAGRTTRLEINAPELGAQEEEHAYPLRGVSYDPRDGRVAIMLGRQADTEHRLTHTIATPDTVELQRDDAGRDRALCIARGATQTLLRLA